MGTDPTVEDELAADLEIGDSLLSPRVTGAQLRGGRAMLNVSQREIARHLAISTDTLWRLESGHRPSTERTRKQVERLLKRNGVIFGPGGTVSLKKPLER
jgi:predicted transcriptional regulator